MSREAVRRSLLFRLTALWALLVFAAGWSEGGLVLRPCPHHDAIGHAGAMAGGHMAHTAPQHGGHLPDPGAHRDPCTCTTACSGTGVAATTASPETRLILRTSTVRGALSTTPVPLPARRRYVLPYPTAPPARPA